MKRMTNWAAVRRKARRADARRLAEQTEEQIANVTEQPPDVTIADTVIENCGTGIQAEGSVVKGRRVRLQANQTGIHATDSHLDFEDLDIS